VNRYGCRIVTIAGAVLAALGIAVSAAAPNIVVLYLTIGLITGKQQYSFWKQPPHRNLSSSFSSSLDRHGRETFRKLPLSL
jgi:hypothetical protein